MKMAQAGAPLWGDLTPTITTVSQIAAAALWGFGRWWVAAATLLLQRYLRIGRVPYGLGWWAFTFHAELGGRWEGRRRQHPRSAQRRPRR